MMLTWFARLYLAAGLALLPVGPSTAQQGAGTTLCFVPHADLSILDPYFTGTYITRNYGYMVFDTLFATAHAFPVNAPRSGLFARDAVDKRRETHNDLLMGD